MQRAFTNILSADVNDTANFFQSLLGMKRHSDSDWFVILTHQNMSNFELGILSREHKIVPQEVRHAPAGIILTFVVSDVMPIFEKAKSLQAEIISAPTDMPYGQCRMLIRDPNGTVIDISAPTAPAPT